MLVTLYKILAFGYAAQTKSDTYKGVRFTSDATITSINMTKTWYCILCTQRMWKVTEENGIYNCIDHGPKPYYRYNFKGSITDLSATAALLSSHQQQMIS